ncbi:MAG TPA: family 16 glycoside hydrolase [Candidatus Angelobacter sp.]|nr:family 16 glycoside hydrolase [Candidatus Angelobacter sp.]
MAWKPSAWKTAAWTLPVVAAGALIWFMAGEDRDDDDDRSGAANAAATENPVPVQQTGTAFQYNFDSDTPGQLPAKFHQSLTGGGGAVKWIVQQDDTAPSKPNVLAQVSADQTDYRFPLAIADEGSFRDLDLSVKFKAISGNVDRAGGLVFRLKDANNYYVVRANALEDNFNFYHVVNGKRRQIKGSNVKVSSGQWHELRIEANGSRFTCYFDGDKRIEATDDTFKDAGKIGLWTKADSVTAFDDLKVLAK